MICLSSKDETLATLWLDDVKAKALESECSIYFMAPLIYIYIYISKINITISSLNLKLRCHDSIIFHEIPFMLPFSHLILGLLVAPPPRHTT